MIHFARWKIYTIFAVVVLGIVFAAPNFVPTSVTLPDWLSRVTLGLDLQGGSHLLYEVDVDAFVHEHLESVEDSVRTELRAKKIGYTGLDVQGDSVRFKLTDPARIPEVRDILDNIAAGMQVELTADGQARLRYSEEEIARRSSDAVSRSIEVIRRRVDELGTREPTIQRQGDDRILIQLPGVKDPEQVKQIIGKTAKMTFRLVEDTIPPDPTQVPPTAEILPGDKPNAAGQVPLYVVQKRVMVSGENLEDAQLSFQGTEPVVAFRFDSVGARRFGDATRQNVGRLFAIVLDDKVISAPVIRGPIPGGSGIIEGGFTSESAQELALLLRAGALPAALTPLEERTVGADLGADSIKAGVTASLVALVLIVVMMMAVYGLFGIFANIALVVNGLLLLGALSALGATLTLPGIAGIVLTLGMAVDSNVIIFERIREEIRGGRSPISALDIGYREAMNSVVDANVTTLVSAVLLYQFGSGPVRGFAVTLGLGILTTMFTAIMFTRLITVLWLRRARPAALPL